MVKLFWKSGFSGIYFGVVEEGAIAAGDSIELLDRSPNSVTIAKSSPPIKVRPRTNHSSNVSSPHQSAEVGNKKF